MKKQNIMKGLCIACLLLCMPWTKSKAAETQQAQAHAAQDQNITVYKGQDYSRVYDYEYYVNHYPAVKRAYGEDREKTLKNFVTKGMPQARQGCASFNVKSYVFGNADLRKKYGNTFKKYYLHYQKKGYKSAARCATATGLKKMQNLHTVYKGIDYSRVYSWRYYRRKYPRLYKKFRYNDYAMLKYFVQHDYSTHVKAKKKVNASDYEAVESEKLAVKLGKTQTARKTDQILLVMNHQFSRWNKNAQGKWERDIITYCGYGKNGLSANRHEGDNTTPTGAYKVLYAFGKAANPGTKLNWKQITPNSYFSGKRDGTYNTWVESKYPIAGEHLTDYYQYEYALFFDYNRNPTVIGRGSAIFLHVKSYDHWSTAGCVSVEKEIMKKVITEASASPYIIIVPDAASLSAY